VIEVAGMRAPEQAIVNRCLDYLGSARAQTEYWLLGNTDEQVRAHYDAFITAPPHCASLPWIRTRSKPWS
jgi:hypothetical protein